MVNGRYINVDKYVEHLNGNEFCGSCEYELGINDAIKAAINFQSVDVVEVVRCKDCKYCGSHIGDGFAFCSKIEKYTKYERYCADGERKTE